MATNVKLSDISLGLLQAQTRWGSGGVAARIYQSPDPDRFRCFWAGLTLYRWAGTPFQQTFDQALTKAQGTNRFGIHIQSVIQAKHEMMAEGAAADFPFCLTPEQWHDKCVSLWGGQIDGTDYTPPSVYVDLAVLVGKGVFSTLGGMMLAAAIPEAAIGAGVIAALGSTAMARGLLVAGANMASEGLLPGGNPIKDANTAVVFERYKLENQRRKLS